MNTAQSQSSLIASLTEELEPVRQFSARDGALWVALAVAATAAGVYFNRGFWTGIFEGQASPFFWITNGLLILLGLAAATAVVSMASPKVGNRYDAPRWASAMITVLPIAAIISALAGSHDADHMVSGLAEYCFTNSVATSIIVAGALTLWLRRGAPVSLNLAGWFTGMAAGAMGTAIYGLSCPIDSVMHLGVAHVMPVAATAIVGRIVVPFLVRW